jgi:hypothetical protein
LTPPDWVERDTISVPCSLSLNDLWYLFCCRILRLMVAYSSCWNLWVDICWCKGAPILALYIYSEKKVKMSFLDDKMYEYRPIYYHYINHYSSFLVTVPSWTWSAWYSDLNLPMPTVHIFTRVQFPLVTRCTRYMIKFVSKLSMPMVFSVFLN